MIFPVPKKKKLSCGWNKAANNDDDDEKLFHKSKKWTHLNRSNPIAINRAQFQTLAESVLRTSTNRIHVAGN